VIVCANNDASRNFAISLFGRGFARMEEIIFKIGSSNNFVGKFYNATAFISPLEKEVSSTLQSNVLD